MPRRKGRGAATVPVRTPGSQSHCEGAAIGGPEKVRPTPAAVKAGEVITKNKVDEVSINQGPRQLTSKNQPARRDNNPGPPKKEAHPAAHHGGRHQVRDDDDVAAGHCCPTVGGAASRPVVDVDDDVDDVKVELVSNTFHVVLQSAE